MNVLVLPYKSGSQSSKMLASSLQCKRMRTENSSVKDRTDLTIINWGNSTTDLSHLPSVKILNHPLNVRLASHKLDFFRHVEAENKDSFVPVNIPDWTTDQSVAKEWYSEGHDVVVRGVLQGHSGEGITLVQYKDDVTPSQAIPKAPLYTKYMKKRDEYRVHVVKGVPILVQRKATKYGATPENYQIRNHSNGFIFTVSDVNPDDSVISNAINAVNVLGLDFGAVDVIWNERKKKATVLEVNTACGLEGMTTLSRYLQSFTSILDGNSITHWKDALARDLRDVSLFGSSDTTPADIRLRMDLEMLDNSGWEDQDHIDLEDRVVISLSVHEAFRNYEVNGGTNSGILRYLEDQYTGSGGTLYLEDMDDDGEYVRVGFYGEDEDYDIIPFVIPRAHVDYGDM